MSAPRGAIRVRPIISWGDISEALARGCGKIYLESTVEGRPVYRELGFLDMPDMIKYYDQPLSTPIGHDA